MSVMSASTRINELIAKEQWRSSVYKIWGFRDPDFPDQSFCDRSIKKKEKSKNLFKSHATDGNLRRNNRSILKELQL